MKAVLALALLLLISYVACDALSQRLQHVRELADTLRELLSETSGDHLEGTFELLHVSKEYNYGLFSVKADKEFPLVKWIPYARQLDFFKQLPNGKYGVGFEVDFDKIESVVTALKAIGLKKTVLFPGVVYYSIVWFRRKNDNKFYKKYMFRMTSEAVYDENDTFKLVLLTQEHLSEAATVVATAFTKTEPLGANYWEIDQALPFTTCTTQLGINEKISYVVKEKSTNKIVHVLLNFDYSSPIQYDWSLMPKTTRHDGIHTVIEALGEPFRKENPEVPLGKVLHLWMVATLTGYERRGFLKMSTAQLIKDAKQRGFEKIVVEATSEATHHVLSKYFGFVTHNTVIPSELLPNVFGDLNKSKCTYIIKDLNDI